MLAQRIGSAAVALPLLVAVVVYGPTWLYVLLVAGLTLWSQWELYRMFGAAGVRADVVAGLACGALVTLAFAAGTGSRGWAVPLALVVAVTGCLTAALGRPEEPARAWPGVALTLLGVAYCALLLGHAVWLRALPGGARLVLFVLWVTWCGESAAYFVGRRWGRRRLAPRISPAKTVEGAVAQWAASFGAAALAWPALPMGAGQALVAAGLLGIVGQLGDLGESFLKRSVGTKDAGALLPGHGGLLDRVDSLLFNLPALYYYQVFWAVLTR